MKNLLLVTAILLATAGCSDQGSEPTSVPKDYFKAAPDEPAQAKSDEKKDEKPKSAMQRSAERHGIDKVKTPDDLMKALGYD